MSKKKRRQQTTVPPIPPAKPVDPQVLRAVAAVLRKLAALLEAAV